MADLKVQALKQIYNDFFKGDGRQFIAQNTDFKSEAWLKLFRSNKPNLISDECYAKIVSTLKNSKKGEIYAQYLIQENKIEKYKTFIKIWTKFNPTDATTFQQSLDMKIQNHGLKDTDLTFEPQIIVGLNEKSVTGNGTNDVKEKPPAETNEDLALKQIYNELFKGDGRKFITENTDFQSEALMGRLQESELISDECYKQILAELNDGKKGEIYAQYLIQENDIKKYKTFIQIWREYWPEDAITFQRNLDLKIERHGLIETDSKYVLQLLEKSATGNGTNGVVKEKLPAETVTGSEEPAKSEEAIALISSQQPDGTAQDQADSSSDTYRTII